MAIDLPEILKCGCVVPAIEAIATGRRRPLKALLAGALAPAEDRALEAAE